MVKLQSAWSAENRSSSISKYGKKLYSDFQTEYEERSSGYLRGAIRDLNKAESRVDKSEKKDIAKLAAKDAENDVGSALQSESSSTWLLIEISRRTPPFT
jgi:hypothetical protein